MDTRICWESLFPFTKLDPEGFESLGHILIVEPHVGRSINSHCIQHWEYGDFFFILRAVDGSVSKVLTLGIPLGVKEFLWKSWSNCGNPSTLLDSSTRRQPVRNMMDTRICRESFFPTAAHLPGWVLRVLSHWVTF